jgi:hypothetical protein
MTHHLNPDCWLLQESEDVAGGDVAAIRNDAA